MPPAPPQPLLLDPPEAAALLGVSVWTLRRWAKAGRVPRVQDGRRMRFGREALEEWVRVNVVGGGR